MKNLRLKSQSGFTLVETIVVAILTSVLALGAYSVFMMYISETREISMRTRLQTQYETLADEIARTVRSGKMILVSAEGDSVTIIGEEDETTVFNIDDEGTVQIKRDDDAALQPFRVAGNPIFVDREASAFMIDSVGGLQVGTQLRTNFKLLNDTEDPRYTLTVNGGFFRCRF